MAYTKHTWSSEKVTPALLNNLETQYEKAVVDLLSPLRIGTTKDLVAEVLASAPAHAEGRIYFNSADGKLYISDGTNWVKFGGD